ncbi:MAG TPA: hypothetical protein VGM88_00740 [Kofleriaceae bacterium]|jgi:hypothetical protein
MTKTLRWAIAAGVVVAGTLPAAAAPKTYERPMYSHELDAATEAAARESLLEVAAKDTDVPEDMRAKLADIMLAKNVIATSSDTGCPGVDVDIVNASEKVIWNIAVSIEQKDTTSRTDKTHIPYMTPHSQVRITVPCVQDYTYGSTSYSAGGGIRVGYDAEGAADLAGALQAMIDQPVDFRATPSGIDVTTEDKSRNMLEATLDTVGDRAAAHDLVMAIAKTGVGTKELGAALAKGGTVASEVAASMSSLPRDAQAQLGRTLIASTAAIDWKDKLGGMIDGQLCTGVRRDVLALWLRSEAEADIPVVALRDRVRLKCKPNASDAGQLVAAVELAPDYAGALDNVDAALFNAVVGKWKASSAADGLLPLGTRSYLRYGGNPERIGKALAIATDDNITDAIDAMIRTPEATPADAVALKAKSIESYVKGSTISDRTKSELVVHLFDSLLDGTVAAPGMRDAIRALKSVDSEAANRSLAKFGDAASKVLDPSPLAAANIEVTDFLAFNAKSLDSCTMTPATLEECAQAITAWNKGALVPVVAKATRAEFATAARRIVEIAGGDEQVALGKALIAAGFDHDIAVGPLCDEAERKLADQIDATTVLERVADIDAQAPCIATMNEQAASNHHKAIALAIVAILGIVVPLPAGGFWMRRKWRKVAASLPETLPKSDATGAKLADKLGAAGLERGLRAGVQAVASEVPGAAGLSDAAASTLAETVRRAVKTGDAATLLRRVPGGALYFVALPLRDPRPQAVQRYLGDEWPGHLAAIQRSVGAPVTALIVFCGPDAKDATLLAATNDGARASDPDALLEAREARERGANSFRHVITLGEGA